MSESGEWIALGPEELEAFVNRVKGRDLDARDYDLIVSITLALAAVTKALREKEISIARLRAILFGASTEKLENVTGAVAASDEGSGENGEPPKPAPLGKRKGHGKNGANAYPEANRVPISHESLHHGDSCPCCSGGKVYREKDPAIAIRITGSPPLSADRYERERLRCHLCGTTFVAALPPEAGEQKYDETAVTAIALLKYGAGMPFYRLSKIQGALGVPLPPTTQWDLVATAADRIMPAFQELMRRAAQGDLIYTDDTNVKLLSPPQAPATDEKKPERTGTFTSGIVSHVEGHQIALYRTGHKHAGENLGDLLRKRDPSRGPPMEMCDGLARNLPKEFAVILANCTSHSRRKFVEIYKSFPVECRFVLEVLRDVYHNDALAKERRLSPEERLAFHQEASGPRMEELKVWLHAQIDEKIVEPNSSLGKAINYMLKRWEPLTLFLRRAGAPLDNNLCEQILKLAILNRKNSLFYKTLAGAMVGDMYMSLIQTCRLCGANPFDYITALQRHVPLVYANSSAWLPWNYREALAVAVTARTARPGGVTGSLEGREGARGNDQITEPAMAGAT